MMHRERWTYLVFGATSLGAMLSLAAAAAAYLLPLPSGLWFAPVTWLVGLMTLGLLITAVVMAAIGLVRSPAAFRQRIGLCLGGWGVAALLAVTAPTWVSVVAPLLALGATVGMAWVWYAASGAWVSDASEARGSEST